MNTSDRKFTDSLINSIKAAASELEELQVQLALGKAEAKDLFDELKKNFKSRMGELKAMFNAGSLSPALVSIFKRLQAQLSNGLAETRDLFEKQVHSILEESSRLETEIENSLALHKHAAEIKLEIEKFKAKAELLHLQYQLKKITMAYHLQEKKLAFHHEMDLLKTRLSAKELQARDKWLFFKKEIDTAYLHLKKAFTQ